MQTNTFLRRRRITTEYYIDISCKKPEMVLCPLFYLSFTVFSFYTILDMRFQRRPPGRVLQRIKSLTQFQS